jgi:hypothetical protein
MNHLSIDLSHERLARMAGQTFAVAVDGVHVTMVLEQVSTPWVHEDLSSFVALFTAPLDHEIPAGRYALRSANDVIELWLDRVATDLRFAHYEAFIARDDFAAVRATAV